MKFENLKLRYIKYTEKIRFMEYIYLLYIAEWLYVMVVISEYDIVRSLAWHINIALMIVCIVDFFLFLRHFFLRDKDINQIKFIIVKAVLTFTPILIEEIRNIISKIILGEDGLRNSSQIGLINIWSILASCLIFGIVLIIHAKLSGFWSKHWVSLVLCLYLLVTFTFSLVYYTCDYNSVNTYSSSFSYSDKLEKEIRSRNILNNDHFSSLDDFQKDAIREIINSDKDNIENMKIDIDGQEIILTNGKIGKNWASYYYQDLVKKYNSYSIRSITPLKLSRENLTRDSVSYGRDYTKFLNKEYVLAKIELFKTPAKEFDGAILLTKALAKSNDVKELYLVFERENFENYMITTSKLEINIFMNCLSESNTLMDSMIIDLKTMDRASSSLFEYLYYSFVVITTLGFGDITPISITVRTLTIIEAFSGLIIMGLFLAKAFEGKNSNKIIDTK